MVEIPGRQDGEKGLVKFKFDGVFDMHSTQRQVFDESVKPIVASVMEGFNGSILAYGQTSSGKTHTMMGPDMSNQEERGVIPRMVQYVF